MADPFVIQGIARGLGAVNKGLQSSRDNKRRRKRIKGRISELQRDKKQDVIDVNNIGAAIDRGIVADSSKAEKNLSRAYNTDIGQIRGQVATDLGAAKINSRADLLSKNDMLTSAKKERIDREISNLRDEQSAQGDPTMQTIGDLIGIAGETTAQILQQKKDAELAAKRQQDAENLMPRVPAPVDSPEYSHGNIAQQPANSYAGYENALDYGQLQQNTGYQPKNLKEQIAYQLMQSGDLDPKEYVSGGKKTGKDNTKDYASLISDDMTSIKDKYQKNLNQFLKSGAKIPTGEKDRQGYPITRPATAKDYTGEKPGLDKLFNEKYRPEITRTLGKEAADSVYNIFNPPKTPPAQGTSPQPFGVGAIPANDGSLSDVEYQQLQSAWLQAALERYVMSGMNVK